MKIFLSVCIFIITYNEVAEISKDISDDKYTQNLFKKFFPDSDFSKTMSLSVTIK